MFNLYCDIACTVVHIHFFVSYTCPLNIYLWKNTFNPNIMGQYVLAWASLMAQTIKNLPAMWESWVQFLAWEDPLEQGMATHLPMASILVWRVPWTEKPIRLQSMGMQRVRHDWVTKTHRYTHTHTHTRTCINFKNQSWNLVYWSTKYHLSLHNILFHSSGLYFIPWLVI